MVSLERSEGSVAVRAKKQALTIPIAELFVLRKLVNEMCNKILRGD